MGFVCPHGYGAGMVLVHSSTFGHIGMFAGHSGFCFLGICICKALMSCDAFIGTCKECDGEYACMCVCLCALYTFCYCK